MMFKQPSRYFIVSGSAEGYSLLNAFDQALLQAGVGDTNLVRMSSILPPYCECIEPGILPKGCLVPVAYSEMSLDEEGEYISASIAIGIPADPNEAGLIMEYHAKGRQAETEEQVRQMAIKGMHFRQREIKDVLSIAVEHQIQRYGSVFAGVVLWDNSPLGKKNPNQ